MVLAIRVMMLNLFLFIDFPPILWLTLGRAGETLPNGLLAEVGQNREDCREHSGKAIDDAQAVFLFVRHLMFTSFIFDD